MSRTADIRVDVLTYLYSSRPHHRTVENIVRGNRRDGQVQDQTTTEVERELAYLEGKQLVAKQPRELDQATNEWTITAAGIDHMEREGWL